MQCFRKMTNILKILYRIKIEIFCRTFNKQVTSNVIRLIMQVLQSSKSRIHFKRLEENYYYMPSIMSKHFTVICL